MRCDQHTKKPFPLHLITVYKMYLKTVFLQFKKYDIKRGITILYNVKLKKIYIIVVSYLIRMVCKACKFQSTFAICLLIVKILRDFWLSCTSCRLTSWLQGTDDFFAIYTCTVEQYFVFRILIQAFYYRRMGCTCPRLKSWTVYTLVILI